MAMKQVKLKTEDTPFKYAAVIDARMKNIAGASKHSAAKKLKAEAEKMKMALEMVYNAACVYINYRDKFIALKMESPTVHDKATLALLEGDWAAEGITKAVTAQGIIYRIPA